LTVLLFAVLELMKEKTARIRVMDTRLGWT